jgi:hypothetical protein
LPSVFNSEKYIFYPQITQIFTDSKAGNSSVAHHLGVMRGYWPFAEKYLNSKPSIPKKICVICG